MKAFAANDHRKEQVLVRTQVVCEKASGENSSEK